MALTPATIGKRYSPLIILAAVQLLLVVLSPSTPKNSAAAGLSAGAGTSADAGPAAGDTGAAATGDAGAAGGPAAAANGGGAAAGTPGAKAGTPGAAGGPAAAGPAAGGGAVDRSHCDAAGKQIGPTFYMPPCAPVWHGGDNGGGTMTGVSADKINYIYYRAQGNAQVNAVLQQEDLAATDTQVCDALKQFNAEINKRWEGYGRKFVSLDGPAGENHSGASQGSPCSTPYYQGQCSLTPPDPQCERGEADEIATMKPAYVMAPTADPAFYNELAKKGIIVSGGETEPDSFHSNAGIAPYYWDVFMNGDRDMQMTAEYYCKKLAGKPVQFAGTAPGDVQTNFGVGSPPVRKVAITYPATNGDPTYDVTAKEFAKLVGEGSCGGGQQVKLFPYQSDITTAQTQSTTIVSEMKNDKDTTVVFFGDPIAPVFLSNTMDSQHYHPEMLLSGIGLVDYDALGQLYNTNEWQHAFGLSTLTNSIPFDQSDAVAAYKDVGAPNAPDKTENLNWAYFTLMATSFQEAGVKPTAVGLRNGLFALAPQGGDPVHATIEFGHPDTASPQGDYTGIRDAREVYWCANQPSPINGHNGTYVPVDGGKRYGLGAWPAGSPAVFPNGPC